MFIHLNIVLLQSNMKYTQSLWSRLVLNLVQDKLDNSKVPRSEYEVLRLHVFQLYTLP